MKGTILNKVHEICSKNMVQLILLNVIAAKNENRVDNQN